MATFGPSLSRRCPRPGSNRRGWRSALRSAPLGAGAHASEGPRRCGTVAVGQAPAQRPPLALRTQLAAPGGRYKLRVRCVPPVDGTIRPSCGGTLLPDPALALGLASDAAGAPLRLISRFPPMDFEGVGRVAGRLSPLRTANSGDARWAWSSTACRTSAPTTVRRPGAPPSEGAAHGRRVQWRVLGRTRCLRPATRPGSRGAPRAATRSHRHEGGRRPPPNGRSQLDGTRRPSATSAARCARTRLIVAGQLRSGRDPAGVQPVLVPHDSRPLRG